jgi:hypothetical protein
MARGGSSAGRCGVLGDQNLAMAVNALTQRLESGE